jgi:hypothetical protein
MDYPDNPEGFYQCSECSLNFPTYIKLKNHKAAHLNTRTISVKLKNGVKKLTIDKCSNGKFKCPYCFYEFTHFPNLSRHLKDRCSALKGK